MKSLIQKKARELGFDACRVTTSQAPASSERFLEALSEGRHGEMAWLARNAEKRVDLQRVLEGIRSVVTLAVSYFMEEPIESGKVRGVVARYARFSDYHTVLAEPLKELAGFIDSSGGAGTRSLWYVDTGPILERDLAQRAGLGFVGKHTNLISRQLGNWFFIAEILTSLELEADEPEKNHCGSCVRCLEACPTGALPAPFTLDSRRCISYLTIEHKGSIPEELRSLIGDRVSGCDACLEVCPWNRFAKEASMLREHRRLGMAQPDLVALLDLDTVGFKQRFAGTPILRTKRRGFLRNVCVALGNKGDRTVLPALKRASEDVEPLIAEHAAWAIREIERRHPASSMSGDSEFTLLSQAAV